MTSMMVFNHHSLPFASSADAEMAIPDFLRICLKARNSGISPILVDERIDRTWFRIELAKDYFWQDWQGKNRNCNKDLITAFRSIVTKQPFFDENDISEGSELFEVSLKGSTDLPAVRAAAWHEAPLVSFPTRAPWQSSPVTVEIRSLNKDSQLVVCSSDLTNFYSYQQTLAELEQFLAQRRASIAGGSDLFEKRQTFFPTLIFCGRSMEQLLQWSAGMTLIKQIAEALKSLDLFCEKWRNGNYQEFRPEYLKENGLNHHVSSESDSVKQNPALRSLREFFLPSGHKRLFEHHIKLTKGYRLHFYADQREKSVYIGYIGPHLRLK